MQESNLRDVIQDNYEINHIDNTGSSQSSDDKKTKCKDCNKSLKSVPSLLKHNVLMHQKRKHVGKFISRGMLEKSHINVNYALCHFTQQVIFKGIKECIHAKSHTHVLLVVKDLVTALV
ncbi:unnamed protein product, partial [Iphiclides podalirius]